MATQLRVGSFQNYSPAARRIAEDHISLLQQLPLSFISFLLKELIEFDWKFPVEQRFLQNQLAYLKHLQSAALQTEMNPFRQLPLSRDLEAFDWVNRPAEFLDKLSAHLWATRQIDAFRTAADQYIKSVYAAYPREPLPMPRLGIVIIGQGVSETSYPLFRKLRRQGTYFTRIQPENGSAVILHFAAQRASLYPLAFAHWYIDGGTPFPGGEALTCISYHALRSVRAQIAQRMQSAFESPGFGPEALRTSLARLKAEDLGLSVLGTDGLLNRFLVKLLTEGSGTQVFSTTFVQWAVREVYRRAEPLTLVARFAPRARSQDISYLLANAHTEVADDPEDSLIDADMGAWYSWLNQQRLTEAERAGFLVWYENHTKAVAVGSSFAPGAEDHTVMSLAELLRRFA